MWVFAHQHKTQPIDNLSLTVSRHCSAPNFVADLNIRNVAYSNRRTIHGFDDNVFNLFHVYGASDSVNQQHLSVSRNVPATDIAIVCFDGFNHFFKRKVELD